MSKKKALEMAAQKGAALLDDRYPRWWTEIDTIILDMGDAGYDVLGQLYGEFEWGLDALGLKGDQDFDLGFSLPGYDQPGFVQLTEIWKNLIEQREGADHAN